MLEPMMITEVAEAPPSDQRWSRLHRAWVVIGAAADWLIGAAALLGVLAALAAVPGLQLLSLGYLLAASGRVARGGRLRDAWIGVRQASRVGKIVVGCWFWLLPARFVAALATSAQGIDPDGPVPRIWREAQAPLIALIVVHLVASCARGGQLRHFAWPPGSLIWLVRRLSRGGLYAEARDATWDFVTALRLPYYFRLGGLGFVGSMVWLVVPVTLLILGRRAPIVALIGGISLGVVATSLPFLQVHFAVEERFRAIFEVRAVRERFRRAPGAFAFALALTVLAALPLHLLKIERVPTELNGLASVVFITFLWPARIACGWAYARGGRRESRGHWVWRGMGRLSMLPIAAVYVLIVFLTQYTSWEGYWSLYNQHMFLVPVPFPGS